MPNFPECEDEKIMIYGCRKSINYYALLLSLYYMKWLYCQIFGVYIGELDNKVVCMFYLGFISHVTEIFFVCEENRRPLCITMIRREKFVWRSNSVSCTVVQSSYRTVRTSKNSKCFIIFFVSRCVYGYIYF